MATVNKASRGSGGGASFSDNDLNRIAAGAAVSCWFGGEGNFARIVAKRELSKPEFEEWLNVWMLARRVSVRGNTRQRFIKFLNEKARPRFMSDSAYSSVAELTAEMQAQEVSAAFELSLMSKFAFTCNPTRFVPYDKRARDGLRGKGLEFEDKDYLSYMEAFGRAKQSLLNELALQNVRYGDLTVGGEPLPRDLFEQRFVDKRLMLLGGFNPEQMLRDSRGLDRSAI